MAETAPLLPGEKMETFTSALKTASGERRPQAIAHRGYKAAFPENTMGAFRGAVEVGAHAIETDIHLSKDGVVVISHDATLERCFGRKEKIVDCDWDYLATLRTLKEPAQSMPRFKDLLEYLASPGLEKVWVILDIKLDNDADTVMRLIASTLKEVKPSTPWRERVLLGCWSTSYLPLCVKYLPDYPVAHIGFNTPYARKFLKTPGVSFSMLQKIMVGPFGKCFRRDVKKAGRSLFVWTVNEEKWMRWSIEKKLDGVITDDPKRYLEICQNYEGEKVHISILECLAILFINILALTFGTLFRMRHTSKVNNEDIEHALDEPSSLPSPRVRRISECEA